MRSLAATYMLVLTLCFSPFSYAQTQQPSAQKKEINKTQAANKAKQMVKGRVLRVEQGKKNYRVKMLKKSGRVVSVSVDKQSGKVVETKKSGKKD
jgi:uncharacterized membrane protein YkoI